MGMLSQIQTFRRSQLKIQTFRTSQLKIQMIREVSDENSMDVSVDFKKYKDQLMSLSQELSDLAQNSLHKVNSPTTD